MRKARSPSPPPRGHVHSLSVPVAEGPERARDQRPVSDYTLAPRIEEPRDEMSETAPLIRRQDAEGGSHSHDHSHGGKSPGGAHSHGHAHGSMNMQAILLHVLGDALGNVGVIATGLIIWQTTWSFKYYFDPVISLIITAIIFSSAMPLGKPWSLPDSCQLDLLIDRFHYFIFCIPRPRCSPKHCVHSAPGCSFEHRTWRSSQIDSPGQGRPRLARAPCLATV